MPAILLIFFLLFQISKMEKAMTLVWGKPTGYENSTIFEANVYSWEQCIQYCYDTNLCIVAFKLITDDSVYDGCQTFDYFEITSVRKLNTSTSSLGSELVFKVTLDNTSTCPKGNNAPLFEAENITSSIENPLVPEAKPIYRISSNGTHWLIDYLDGTGGICNETYLYLRPAGFLCVVRRIWHTCSFGEAIEEIDLNGYFGLTGVASYRELIDFQEDSQTQAKNRDIVRPESMIWLDGTRKPECRVSNWKNITGCDSFNAYEYTDPYNPYAGTYYNWTDDAPRGENCIAMWTRSVSNPSRVGKVTDFGCDIKCWNDACPIGAGFLALPMKLY